MSCPSREEDDSYSDDDDVSWKVRRAAAKCLAVILGSRPSMLPEFYHTVSPALINRFKGEGVPPLLRGGACFHGSLVLTVEREENVKADIFLAYRALLAITKPLIVRQRVDTDSMETPDRWAWPMIM